MTNERRVLVHPDKQALGASVAARFITKIIDVIDDQGQASIAISGGSVSTLVLAAIGQSPARESVDWSKVHVWWVDERWVPKGDADRNDTGTESDFFAHVSIPDDNIHRMPSSDEGLTIDEAAAKYAEELAGSASSDAMAPSFDITLLGVGPDGHTASLFPEFPQLAITDRSVVPVDDSPKPPPQRLTLTYPVINASQRVWVVLSGAEKASVLGLALAGASVEDVPVGGVQGRKRTVFFIDQDAARDVPENLIASTY
ncbi:MULTISPECIES: 6-phosphogluconolactonase [unclassified Curtobacterium]|uniref:6-phosphogluconolactonase n=1 Tax=unclassified Curtobacterium TaxID=257496 RepID=UPI000DA725D3|nr:MULTISPECIES: 6-phosphogluconolactonase [unclassified Curtobacterium]PZE28787.1 6-phosphogluconolactonase [Curtobacterium sp. MCBD17_028]PZF59182.1 6-phosphogluconolactonase [Curtobacterium sp. MCBD17_034]PZM34276.1 6-phosphogluconolactonase [Curtobacterium sp. MCBD17_031]WIB62261.1 6-phosphogluconolactonase [Curtobacterium sp. MCBD17_040]WIE53248.1 6-phosphogluconolactonase [Curtobacterium sp. MCBD17_003]